MEFLQKVLVWIGVAGFWGTGTGPLLFAIFDRPRPCL